MASKKLFAPNKNSVRTLSSKLWKSLRTKTAKCVYVLLSGALVLIILFYSVIRTKLSWRNCLRWI